MLVPIPTHSSGYPEHPMSDAVDLKVAIKLLSGTECERDASQAQKMLLRLVESQDRIVASDAQRLVKAGVSNKWFSEKTPRHYELERIAEASLARLARNPQLLQIRIAVVAGIALLVAGIVAFLVFNGNTPVEDASPSVVAALVVGLALLAVAFKFGIQRKD